MKYVIYIPEGSDTTGFKHYGNENSGRHKRGTGVQPYQALKRAHIIPWGENFRKKAKDVKNVKESLSDKPANRQNSSSKGPEHLELIKDILNIAQTNPKVAKVSKDWEDAAKDWGKASLSDKSANRQNGTSKTKSEDVKVTYDKMKQAYEEQKAMFKYADEMYRKIDKDYEKVSAALSKNPSVKGMYPVAVDRAKTDSKPIIYLDSDYLKSDADYNAAAKEWEKLGYYVEKL